MRPVRGRHAALGRGVGLLDDASQLGFDRAQQEDGVCPLAQLEVGADAVRVGVGVRGEAVLSMDLTFELPLIKKTEATCKTSEMLLIR